MKMQYKTAVMRQFLKKTFDDEELTDLCFDYFPELLEDFTVGMGKGQKVRALIGYCQRRNRLPDLMAVLERERPYQYQTQFTSVLSPSTPVAPPPTRNPRQVFVGHAHQDAELGQRLAADLEADGWSVWIAPDSIRPGEKWVEAINRGLEESGVFVLLLTPTAVNSQWVQSETNAAIELEHLGELRFIPLQIEPCRAPPLWRAYQRISFRNGYETGLNALLARLENGEPAVSRFGASHTWLPDTESAPGANIPRLPFPDMADPIIWETDGKEMVHVPGGEFFYGYENRVIYLPEFWIDKTAVTNAEYAQFVTATKRKLPKHWPGNLPNEEIADHPAVYVSWFDAAAYGRWAGKGLPTEAQWEKAARGTDGRKYPWGNIWPSAEFSNLGFITDGTTQVGRYSPQGDSPYGCVDMGGNVWEWTGSWYRDMQKYRVLRGGSWSLHPVNAHICIRHGNLPYFSYFNIGFRLVSPPPIER